MYYPNHTEQEVRELLHTKTRELSDLKQLVGEFLKTFPMPINAEDRIKIARRLEQAIKE